MIRARQLSSSQVSNWSGGSASIVIPSRPPAIITLAGNGVVGGGTATASSFVDANRTAPKAFDAITDDATNCWHSAGTGTPWWLKYDFGSGVLRYVTQYWLMRRPSNDGICDDWVFAGSNDDSSWTTLDTKAAGSASLIPTSPVLGSTSVQPAKYGVFNITSPGYYRYYRLYINANTGGAYAIVGEMALIGY